MRRKAQTVVLRAGCVLLTSLATLLWFIALIFADSEADEIPVGVLETTVWFATSTGSMACAWGALVMVVRGRQIGGSALMAAAAVMGVGFYALLVYLTSR